MELVEKLERELLAAKEQLQAAQKELSQYKKRGKGAASAASSQGNTTTASEKPLHCVQELFEHSRDFAVLISVDGQVRYINPVLKKAAGISKRKKLSSIHVLAWYADGEREKIAEEVLPHTLQHGLWDGDTELVVANRVIPVFLQCILHRGEDGEPAYISMVMHDRSAERNIAQVQRAEERWRHAFEGNDDGVWDWDVPGGTVFFSKRWKEMLGYEDSDVGTALEDWSSRVHPDDVASTLETLQQYLDGKAAAYQKEYRMRCKDGTYIWVFDRGKVIERAKDGKPLRMVGTHTNIHERKKVEEKLRISEERFRTMSEAVPVGIFLGTLDGQRAYSNRRCDELCGIVPDDTDGFKWRTYVHPDDKERVTAEWTEAVQAGKTFHAEFRFLHENGHVVYVQGQAGPLRDGGEVVGYVGILEDMTEHKATEEKLRKMEERWQFAIEGSGDGAWDWDIQENTVFFSKRWKEMLGYEAHEVGNTKEEWTSRIHPDDVEWMLTALHHYLQGKSSTYKTEIRMQCKDGSYKWILTRGKVVERLADGTASRMVGTFSDVTEWKLAEEHMRRSEERFRAISDAVPVGIFVTNAQGHCEYTNRVYQRIAGLSLQESLGSGWSNAIHPDDRTRVFGKWYNAALHNIPFESEHRFLRSNGDVLWTQVKTEAMRDGAEVVGYIGVVEDITARKKAEQKLRDTLALQTAILDGTQHFILSMDADGIIQVANAAAEKLLGYGVEEIIGMNSLHLHVQEELAKRARELAQELECPVESARDAFVLKAELYGQEEAEWTYIRKDGTHFIARVFVAAMRDSADILTGFLAMGLDITEQKAAEQVIQRQNQMLNGILTSLPVIAYRIDENKCITEIQGRALQRLGTTQEELLGRGVTELFASISDAFRDVHSGNVAVTEYSGLCQGVSWFFHNYLFADQYQEGYVIGFALDDTDRRTAEEDVRRSQANLSAVFNSTTDAIWAIDTDYRLLAYNDSFARYMLRTEGIRLATGMHITEVLAGEELQRWHRLYSRVLSGENFVDNLETVMQGRQQYFDINFSPIQYDGRVDGAVMFSKNMTAHKAAERLLMEKLAMLNAILESTDSVICAVSAEHRYLAFNSAYRNMAQELYGVDVHIGGSILDILEVSPDGEKTKEQLERAMQEGQFMVVEEFDGVDGVKNYNEISFYPIQTDVGSIIGVAIYMRDISKRKRNEDELRRTMVLQKAILDGTDFSIISTDTQGVIQTFNKAAERLLGYDAEEVVGKTTPVLLHDVDEVVERANVLTRELGRTVDIGFETLVAKAKLERVDENEWTYICKDGTRFPVLLSVTALYSADKTITGFLGIGIDITERKQGEALLLKTQKALLEAQRIAKTGSYEIDLVANKLTWTEQVAIVLGFHKNTAMDAVDIFSLIHPDDAAMVQRAWQHMLGYGTVFNCDYRIVRNNGAIVYINGYGKPVFDACSNMVAILGTVQDISERKAYEQELIAARDAADSANRAKSEFLANMSHEIRTPMNTVLGFSELLQNMVVEPQQQTYIKAILNSGKMLLTLINDILDLSKIEAGSLEFFYELEDVNPIVQEIQQLFSVRVREKNIELLLESNVHTEFVVDSTRLRQVLLNLVGNAVKFTDSGFVKITVGEKTINSGVRALHLAIEDTGIGIPANQQEVIFEAFRQQDGQSTRKYGGTGLGLSITKRLVEAMNGTIRVYSKVGKGSTFEVLLPEARVSNHWSRKGTSDSEWMESNGEPDFGNALLLVVDDVELNRTLVREMLALNNVHIVECSNGKEAIAAVQQHNPALILMDLRMPDINGYEAAQHIRAIAGREKTPIVFLTASVVMDDVFTQALEKEAFLYKPVSRREMLTLLSSMLPYTAIAREDNLGSLSVESTDDAVNTPLLDGELSEEERAVLPELLYILRTEYIPVWAEVHSVPVIDEVEAFAQNLQQLGKNYNMRMLIRYSEILLTQVQSVDILAFPTTLAQFPDVVDTMEKNAG